MSASASLLIEIGVEELPPLSMRRLSEALGQALVRELSDAGLTPGAATNYASPRRLAVLIENVDARQADRDEVLRGPPVSIAFDDDGQPTKALEAFAAKAGCKPADVQRVATDKGEWITFEQRVTGADLATVLQPVLTKVAAALPIDRRMRWGAGAHEFVRPVHWLVALHGSACLDISLFDIAAGRTTHGHRFHAPAAISLASADEYELRLKTEGYVVPALDERVALIDTAVTQMLADIGAKTESDPALLEEIAAIVEWPRAVLGEFDARFLELPPEVLVSTLKKHQRYFPVEDAAGRLMAKFVTIANLESKDPTAVALGNQRVVTPRLDDAVFFYKSDLKRPLDENVERLKSVVYEKSLGSLYDKSQRVGKLAGQIASTLGEDGQTCERIVSLARADLVSDMVGEFPDLQGVMGGYYAAAAGESPEVASGIRDFYRPASAADRLPETMPARVVGIAERLDTLAGVFAAGKRPKGNKDPFGLRRAALGVARLILESDFELDLVQLISDAVELQPVASKDDGLADAVFDFVMDRLLGYYQGKDKAVTVPVFDTLRARRLSSLTDFSARLSGVVAFAGMEASAALAAANKRIANVLRKAPAADQSAGSAKFQAENDAEADLHAALSEVEPVVAREVADRNYVQALTVLSKLREPIDRYFEDVMVMADDPGLQQQRLQELARVRALFLSVADVSVMGR